MKNNGTYDEFIKDIEDKNFNVWLNDIVQEYNNWLKYRDSKTYITEAGDIEDWSGGKSSKELKKEFDEQIEKVKEFRNEKK